MPEPASDSLEAVVEIRDLIDERVRGLAANRIEAIHLNASAHRLRLTKLLPALTEEVGERCPAHVIRGCADRILEHYDDVPIDTHTLTLGSEQTRECLRQARCDVLQRGSR